MNSDSIITSRTVSYSPILNSNDINKTFKEVGFNFEEK